MDEHADDPGAAAGVVLAGGRSTRMGASKAALDWHGSTLLYRTAAVLTRSVSGPVVVVGAPGRQLPILPDGVEVVRDPVAGRGPLQGIAVGLAAVGSPAVAFVTSTDAPFLHPAFVTRVLDVAASGAHGADAVVPLARGHRQPLAAAYRTGLVGLVEDLLAAGERRPAALFERCAARYLDDAELLAGVELSRLDPDLDSLVNLNTGADYAAARARPAPTVLVRRAADRALAGDRAGIPVRAATVAGAAVAVGVPADRRVTALVNDDHATTDPQFPLVTGDRVMLTAERYSSS